MNQWDDYFPPLNLFNYSLHWKWKQEKQYNKNEDTGVFMNNAGKGSKPRPIRISDIEYADRWDAIFGKDLENKPELKEVIEYSDHKLLTEDARE